MRRDLEPICGTCEQVIAPGEDAALWVSASEALRVDDEIREWEKQHERSDGSVVFSAFDPVPGPVNWRVDHAACAPEMNQEPYTVDIDEVTSLRGFVRWSAHMVEKLWVLAATDWTELMAEVAGDRSPERFKPA